MDSGARETVRRRLLDRAFKPGEGVDQHGAALAWSLDCRELTLHGPTLSAIVELLWPCIAAHQPRLIAGPSLSADPLVAALLLNAEQRGIELAGGLLRREPKPYGLRKLIEGPPVAHGTPAVVVDDILMRGRSAARAVRTLRELGASPRAVVTLVDLQVDGCEHVDGIVYDTAFTAAELGLAPFREPPPSPRRGWRLETVRSPIPAADQVPPVVVGKTAVVSGQRRGVLVRREAGDVHQVAPGPARCLAAGDDLFVIGSEATLSAFGVESSRPRWQIELAARALCVSPAGDVFVARDDAEEILRLDACSGATTGRAALADRANALHVVADALIAVTESGLVSFEASLERRWRRPGPAWSPVGANGHLYVLTLGPALTRLHPEDGSVIWSRAAGPRTLPQLVANADGVALAVESVVVSYSDASSVRWVHSAPRRIVAGPVACGPAALAIADRGAVVRVLRTAAGEHVASYSALPMRPVALAASAGAIAAMGIDGDAWSIEHLPQP